MNDWEMLEAYAAKRSEAAFEGLVNRYLGLVYSAALRQVRDAQLAEDVVQAVFLLLARKAGEFRRDVVLTGWLFRTTRFIAARALRSEQRRDRHEQEASAMQTPYISEPDALEQSWREIEPLLDGAVAALSDPDRNAILLRFFRRLPLSEVGTQMGLSEQAAKKRVSRAVEKLRAFFARRGITVTSAALLTLISQRSVGAAPGWLAGKIAAALSAGASSAAVSSTGALVMAGLRHLFWQESRVAIGTAAFIALVLLTLFIHRSFSTRVPDDNRQPAVAAVQAGRRAIAARRVVNNDRVAAARSIQLSVLAAETEQPILGARASLDTWQSDRLERGPELRTDESGTVEVGLPNHPLDTAIVWVAVDGRVPKSIKWRDYELKDVLTRYSVKLTQADRLRGFVRDAQGKPIPGAKVHFRGPGIDTAQRENLEFHRELSAVWSGADGDWSMNQLPQGDPVTQMEVSASHPDFVTTTLGLWTLHGVYTNATLILKEGVPVSGQVISADGLPIPRAQVYIKTQSELFARADASGRFAWDRVERGTTKIQVRATGFKNLDQALIVTDGMDEVIVRLEAVR